MSIRYTLHDLLLPELQITSPEAVVNDWLRSLHAAGRPLRTRHVSTQAVRDPQA
jgi:hypothetical protein